MRTTTRIRANMSAAQLAQVAVTLYEAAETVDIAIKAMSGKAQTGYLRNLLKAERQLQCLAFYLEHDYLICALEEFRTHAPLLGSIEAARAAVVWCDERVLA